MKYILVFILCFFQSLAYGQQFLKQELQDLEDEELLDLFASYHNDTIIAAQIARVYLDRAKQEQDTIKMARGFYRLGMTFDWNKNILYADSIIDLTKNIDHVTYPADGYLLKGVYSGLLGNIKEEMNSYLKGYKIAYKNNNQVQQAWVLQRLILNKSTWGNVKDALSLQYQRDSLISTEVFRKNLKRTTRPGAISNIDEYLLQEHIDSYGAFSLIFLKLNEIDSAKIYLEKNRTLQKSYNGIYKGLNSATLLETSANIDYAEKKYESSLDKFNQLENEYKDVLNPEDYYNIYSRKGFCLYQIKKFRESYHYLKKVDSLGKNYKLQFFPEDREVCQKLSEFAKVSGNAKMLIDYLSQLIKMDSIFSQKYKYFDPTLMKKFDIPNLHEEKAGLIAGLQTKNKNKATTLWFTLLLLAVSICGGLYYFNRQKVYRKRYQAMISGKGQGAGIVNLADISRQELSPEVIEEILIGMERFESRRCFLKADTNLKSMSDFCNTNTNYLSRVINLKLEKNFSQYIHDLRIDYAVNELLVKPIYRKYTIKAIANECGYTNAESFSRAFYKKNGIYPSYYIKKLEKEAM